MSDVKERLLEAITVMTEDDALQLWRIVERMYRNSWDAIEESAPDLIDLQMIRAAQNDPDCRTFASEEEVRNLFN